MGLRNENRCILPASGWVVASLPTFKLMRRLRRSNHERRGGFINIKDMCNNDDCKGGVWVYEAHQVK
jgi:hypothetical protein